jgi:putative transposase
MLYRYVSKLVSRHRRTEAARYQAIEQSPRDGGAEFQAEGIRIIKTPVRAPRENAIMERWVGSVRREILDRILIINAAHLRTVLAEYEAHFNTYSPHRALNQASPLRALPDPVNTDINVIRHDRLGGLLYEYSQVA